MGSNWDFATLSEISFVTDFSANGSFAGLRENVEYIYHPDYAILVRLVDFSRNWDGDLLYIPKHSYDFLKKCQLEVGDVIISNIGANAGILFRVPDLGRPSALGPNALVIKTHNHPNTSKEYLYYYFVSPDGQNQIQSIITGSAQPKFTKTDIRNLKIPFPPLPEQRAVAGILGALDDKIEINRRMNATLESMARAVFRQWFVESDEVEKWGIGKAKDLCLRVENGGTPRRDKPEFWEPGTIPWLTSGEVRQNIITLTENKISELGYENSSAKLWQSGTTVVALYGATAGEVSFIAQELCANQACCGFIPKPEAKYFLYLALSFSVENLSLLARGSAQQNLSQQIVADFPVIIPDNNSLEKFNDIVEPMFDKWILNLKESRTLGSLRDSLLPKLMRGEVRVGA